MCFNGVEQGSGENFTEVFTVQVYPDYKWQGCTLRICTCIFPNYCVYVIVYSQIILTHRNTALETLPLLHNYNKFILLR